MTTPYDVTSEGQPRKLYRVRFKRWSEDVLIYARNRSSAIYGAAKKMQEAGYTNDAMSTAWHACKGAWRVPEAT